MQDSAPFLITYAPSVTFGNLHYNVWLCIFLLKYLFESVCLIVISPFPSPLWTFLAFGSPPPCDPIVLTLTTLALTFEKHCGFQPALPSVSARTSRVSLDLPAIDCRISSLQSVRAAKPYEKQKCSLYLELESFLSSLPTSKSPISASPKDVIRFLVWKDSKGKTKVHEPSCPNFGAHSKRKCRCPTRLAAGTVNSTIGKLRAILNSIGWTGDWSRLSPGNPAAHPSVKKYLISISEEQAKARVSPRQAMSFLTSLLSCAPTYVTECSFHPYPRWKGIS